MKRMSLRQLAAVAVAAAIAPTPAMALVTSFGDQAAFAAAHGSTAFADFEAETPGYTANPLISSGIRFTQLPGAHASITPYIAPPGGAGTVPEAVSNVLEADGDENFRIELASNAGFTALGFALYSNAFAAPTVSLFAPGGGLIGSYIVPQAPETFGYFGLTSTTVIGWAVLTVDRGWVRNVAIDDVSIGAANAVPEPASWAMLIAGFGLTGTMLRRRRRVAA